MTGKPRPALCRKPPQAERGDIVNKRILIVDDEADMRELLTAYLENEGYETASAADGVEAISLFESSAFDLVLLDVMLPKIDGFGVCELIRRRSDVPIIFLSALDGEEELIRGYDLMADDFVTKPFSMPILLRKVAAVFRRGRQDEAENDRDRSIIKYRDILIDRDTMEVTVGGQAVTLTAKEFELLCLLVTNPGRVFTRDMLISRLWDIDAPVEDRIIDSHVKNIRRKIGGDYIETLRGAGYRAAKTAQ